MRFLPVVARELRVASRRRSAYWIRFAAGLAAVLFCAWLILLSSRDPRHTGAEVFGPMAVLVFLYTGLAGVPATADCLSEEKREGTLGLLFLTDLKGFDVVFGKLAATSINAFYGLLAIIPALAIPLLMGGVNSGQVWRVALVAVNLLLFFLAVGMGASAFCRNDHAALSIGASTGLLIMGAAPMIAFVHSVNGRPWNDVFWLSSSPASACVLAFYDSASDLRLFWTTTVITACYSVSLFTAACVLTPITWQDRRSSGRRWTLFSRARDSRRRWSLLDANPYFWRASRRPLQRLLVWLGLALCVAAWLWFRKETHASQEAPELDLPLLGAMNLCLKYWIAVESGRALSEDRRSGAFELLLATPLSEEAIVRGQRLALWRQFGGPAAAVLAAHFWVFLRATRTVGYEKDLAGVILAMALFLVLDGMALSSWSMWLAFSGRKPNRAALLSLGSIVLLPSGLWFLLSTAQAFFAPGGSFWFGLLTWCVLGIGADAFFGAVASQRLRARFRAMVASAPAESRPMVTAPA